MSVLDLQALNRAIETKKKAAAWLLYSSDEYLLCHYAEKLLAMLAEDTQEPPTTLPGPLPDMGQAVAAAGAISMFGGRRAVYLRRIEPGQMPKKDVELLAELMAEAENAYLIITILLPPPAQSWRRGEEPELPAAAKPLLTAALKAGVAAALKKPDAAAAARFCERQARAMGASLPPPLARRLVERCGTDLFLLTQELEKLAAASGYGEIGPGEMEALCPRSIEADVFEMIRALTGGRSGEAFSKLERLLYLQQDPAAIAAAMNGSFVDMVRVRCAAAAGAGYQQAFTELGGRGSSYRYKKSLEASRPFSMAQLSAFIRVLDRLDKKLKGSAVDKAALLQLAMGEILMICRGEGQYADP